MSVAVSDASPRRLSECASDTDPENEPHFEPAITLPIIETSTNEEEEEELIKLRAKLFRFDTANPETPEWKERGTGEVKLLKHKENHAIRVVMRRDKTLKICANHFITPWMELKPSCGSNRAWVWKVPADFADEIAKQECLAIRFASPEIATQWKDKFEEAKKILKEKCDLYKNDNSNSQDNEDDDEEEEEEDDDDDDDDEDEATSPEKEKKEKDMTEDDKSLIKNMSDLNVSK